MILKSIIIENIRSYRHQEVLLDRGVTLFEGDIGSGKSTILMAVEFALFGLGSKKASSLLAKGSDSGSVMLGFAANGEDYEIKRTLKKSGDSTGQDPANSWLRTGGERIPLAPSELKQQVLDILGFKESSEPKSDSRIFRYAIFTPQETMRDVLGNDKNRIETIRKAFGIEDYKTAGANAEMVLRGIKSEISVFKERYADIARLDAEIAASKKVIKESKEAVVGALGRLKEIDEELGQERDERDGLLEQQNTKVKLESDRKNAAYRIDAARQELDRIDRQEAEMDSELQEGMTRQEGLLEIKRPETGMGVAQIDAEIARFQEMAKRQASLDAGKRAALGDIRQIEAGLGGKTGSDVQGLEARLGALQGSMDDLAGRQGDAAGAIEDAKARHAASVTQRDMLQSEVAELGKLRDRCPTCRQEINADSHRSLIDEDVEEIANLDQEIKILAAEVAQHAESSARIQSEIDSAGQEASEIRSVLPELLRHAQKRARIAEIDDEMGAVNPGTEYGDAPAEFLGRLKDQLVRYENAQEQIKHVKKGAQQIQEKLESGATEKARHVDTIKACTGQIKENDAMLKGFGDLDGQIQERNDNIAEASSRHTREAGTVAVSNERIRGEQEKITSNEQLLARSREWKARHDRYCQFADWLESFFIPAISSIERQVMLSTLQDFRDAYAGWYKMLVDDPTKESDVDEGFGPTVSQDGYVQEIASLSGGEKTSIALAYRLTLNTLVKRQIESMGSNLLILDEPTDGFSKTQLSKLREVLDRLESEQIILVSHERELETFADTIHRITKHNGVSQISGANQARP